MSVGLAWNSFAKSNEKLGNTVLILDGKYQGSRVSRTLDGTNLFHLILGFYEDWIMIERKKLNFSSKSVWARHKTNQQNPVLSCPCPVCSLQILEYLSALVCLCSATLKTDSKSALLADKTKEQRETWVDGSYQRSSWIFTHDLIPENFLPILTVLYPFNMENPSEKENNDDNFAVPTQTHGKKFTNNLPTCASWLHVC